MTTQFNYHEAFARNIGILMPEEQERLRRLRVAVPGVGGLGGNHVMSLARLGVGAANIADFDRYECANFNRQYGATVDTLGVPKIEVMRGHMLSVNPEMDVRAFPEGVGPHNVSDFLDGCDIVLDAIDLSAMDARQALYAEARRRGLYVIACGPVGFGFFCLIFDPAGPSFEEVFGIEPGSDNRRRMEAFVNGITPACLHSAYMPPELTDISGQRGEDIRFSWINPAIFLAAGNGIAELVAIVLGRKTPICVPRCYQYDAMLNRLEICDISR